MSDLIERLSSMSDRLFFRLSDYEKETVRLLTVALAELEATTPADAALADELDRCLRNAYEHIQREAYNDALSSILEAQEHAAALRARAVPEGYALVPLQPTTDMILAGFRAIPSDDPTKNLITRVWPAMLAASQRKEGA